MTIGKLSFGDGWMDRSIDGQIEISHFMKDHFKLAHVNHFEGKANFVMCGLDVLF